MLYRDGAGFFPAPLSKTMVPEKAPADMTSEERQLYEEELELRKFNIFQKKILIRDPSNRTHPAVAGLYTDSRGNVTDADDLEKFFRFVLIHSYVPIERIGKWTEDKSVTEIYSLMNEEKLDDKPITIILNELKTAFEDPESKKFRPPLEKVHTAIMAVLRSSNASTAQVSELFDRLLSDQVSEGDAEEALLREFWADSRNNDLRIKLSRQRDKLKYGYPLYLAKKFGRGRVTLITTGAGEDWNNWASERPGSVSYTPVMKELVTYLAGGGVDDNRSCGEPLTLNLDRQTYDPKVLRGFVSHIAKPGEKQAPVGGENDPAPIQVYTNFAPLTEGTVEEVISDKDSEGKPIERTITREVLSFTDRATAQPGVYLYGLEQRRPKPGSPTETITSPEYRFTPVNLQTMIEGDLRRASADDLIADTKAELHGPDDREWIEALKNKRKDLSEMGWVFLFLILVLVAEQALAVKLSYHTGNENLEEDSPTLAAALRKRTAASPANADNAV
jgi:hypothetical protein